MYDEHGFQHKAPQPLAPRPPADPIAIPAPPSKQRPLWLRLGANAVLLVALLRFCSPLETDFALLIIIQVVSALILLVIALGLVTQRRWALRLFLLVCTWSVFSSLLVTAVRLSHLDQIQSLGLRDLVLMTLIRDVFVSLLLYGGLGLLFGLNRHHFQPAGQNRYGNLPFALMFGILVLFTAVQIADARANIALRAETLEDASGLF